MVTDGLLVVLDDLVQVGHHVSLAIPVGDIPLVPAPRETLSRIYFKEKEDSGRTKINGRSGQENGGLGGGTW